MRKFTKEESGAIKITLPILKELFKAPEIKQPDDNTDEGLKAYAIMVSTSIQASKLCMQLLDNLQNLLEEDEKNEQSEEEKKQEKHKEEVETEKRVVGINL